MQHIFKSNNIALIQVCHHQQKQSVFSSYNATNEQAFDGFSRPQQSSPSLVTSSLLSIPPRHVMPAQSGLPGHSHPHKAVGSLGVRASDSRTEVLGWLPDDTKYPPSTHGIRAR
ncbi:hypothetical protein TNCV_4079141 [Trichonephila clavipes]|nr:hypothetical protein TNCV_4079141 [Trichonephila clavipes]